jgi:hypothetical protein
MLIDKREPTREDVLAAMAGEVRDGVRTRPEVKLSIVRDVWRVAEVYDTRTASWYVKEKAFANVLAELVADGAVVELTGEELAPLAITAPVTRSYTYLLLAADHAKLIEARDARRAEALRAQAEEYAKGFLIERHRDEYDALVAEFYEGVRKEQ